MYHVVRMYAFSVILAVFAGTAKLLLVEAAKISPKCIHC